MLKTYHRVSRCEAYHKGSRKKGLETLPNQDIVPGGQKKEENRK